MILQVRDAAGNVVAKQAKEWMDGTWDKNGHRIELISDPDTA